MGRVRSVICRIVGATAQGRFHVKNGLPCQDKISHYSKGRVHCIALADGAGFSKYSQIGAKSVTRFLSRYIVRNFYKLKDKKENHLKNIFHRIIMQILYSQAEEVDINVKFLASTLLCIAFDNKDYLMLHIGDGLIGVFLKEDDKIIPISLPDNDEFANTTYFTTSENFTNNLRLDKGDVKKFKGFILMSDGVSESLFDKKNKKLAPAVKNIMKWFSRYNLYDIKKALDYNLNKVFKEKSLDDCSIIIAEIKNGH